ncbi:MAG: ATP synthase F1 subunit gamma [Candidatus Omnitrophica bacterium]|nr:ATP synthase F1 subunit gamma [Candidatus Omnitrophota bacterium]
MQSLKNIKNRIRVIENTHKVTDAMERISVTKLRRVEASLFAIKPYFSHLDSLLHNFIGSARFVANPFLEERPLKQKIGLCVITSDSGLCGLYNNNIIRQAEEFIRNEGRERVKLILIGGKGFKYFKNRGIEILKTYADLHGKYRREISEEITGYLTGIFLSGEVDEVHVAYTRYETALILKPVVRKFLNMDGNYKDNAAADYILEPGADRIIEELLPKYISMSFSYILLEAFTSEHSSRSVAMKMATDNAEELLKTLVLLRNKVRQTYITQDMMEIIASSEALKG